MDEKAIETVTKELMAGKAKAEVAESLRKSGYSEADAKAMVNKVFEEVESRELKELIGGRGDVMFYLGVGVSFLGVFLGLLSKFLVLFGLFGIFLMFYATYHDRKKAVVGKSGNAVALLLAGLISVTYFSVAVAVLFLK